LIGKEDRVRNRRKSAVVPTKSILTAANMPIIGGHHVLALQSPPEGWQATSLLERCREHTRRRWALKDEVWAQLTAGPVAFQSQQKLWEGSDLARGLGSISRLP
jgi:hypothetical protein